MKEIYVNEIIEKNGVTSGFVVYDETILENFKIVFKPGDSTIIYNALKDTKEGYFIERFCQFIVFIQLNHLGWTMRVIDYHNNLDVALDEYTELKGNDWRQEDRDRIMEIFQEIEKDTENVGQMIIKKQHIV